MPCHTDSGNRCLMRLDKNRKRGHRNSMTSQMLEAHRRAPLSGKPAQQLVIFLHGLGADGRDLIDLADILGKALPDAAFASPDAPFPCDMAPYGRQWFGLQNWHPLSIEAGVRAAAPILDAFITAEAARYDLPISHVALLGFSQGSMMTLFNGFRRPKSLAGLVGISGALVAPEKLAEEAITKPPVLIIHGQMDPVVPFHLSMMAQQTLSAAGVDVTLESRPFLAHSIDMPGLEKAAGFLQRCFHISE